MKKTLSLLICIALLLGGCTASTAPTASPDKRNAVTPLSATPDEAPAATPTDAPTQPPTPEELAQERLDAILGADAPAGQAEVDVPEIYQYPTLPTGCEAVAATIAIRSFGYELTAEEFARDWLIRGDDIIHSFVGDPFERGGAGIFPPGLCASVQCYTEGTGAHLTAFDLTGSPADQLYQLLDSGIPVVVWGTYYMTSPRIEWEDEYDGHTVYWYENEHCYCLYGYDKEQGIVRVSDPIQGKVTASASAFESIYDQTGRMAMVLMDTSPFEGRSKK